MASTERFPADRIGFQGAQGRKGPQSQASEGLIRRSSRSTIGLSFTLLAFLPALPCRGQETFADFLSGVHATPQQFIVDSESAAESTDPDPGANGPSQPRLNRFAPATETVPTPTGSPDELKYPDISTEPPEVGTKDWPGTPPADDAQLPSGPPLAIADVIASVYRSFPDIDAARQQPALANGELLSAYGAYDTKFHAHSLSEPTGFYETYRNGLGLARQTWWGGYVSAGYRVGRGFFQPWYKERQTDDAGEFKLAFIQPLLQGRAIDPQRVAVFQAGLARQAAQPMIQRTILDVSLEAARAYWDWVTAGQVLQAQRELLALALRRGEQYEVGVKAGLYAEVDLVFNQQLIAERRAKTIESEQKFRETAFKLALFLRNAAGQPLVPENVWLPDQFPDIQTPPPGDLQADLAASLGRRPEPLLLRLESQQVQWDRRLACNEMLPRLDFVSEASQDMGEPASSSDDKGQFELLVGIQSEVPIQRRKARGKIQSTTAKLAQIAQKIRLVEDKIAQELITAYNALRLAAQVVQQNEVSLRAAIDVLYRYRFAFDRGKIDLIYLNFLETKVNETEIKLVESQRNWFVALAEMQAALGLDPLEQAMNVSALPASERPGPGNLPDAGEADPDELQRDWELHSP